MITKDYQGNTLPASYGTIVQDSNRRWLVKLIMNGTELSCGIKSLEISKGSCGSDSEFTIGNVVSSMMVADLMELTDDVKGEEIEVRVGLDISGTFWWITVGVFTIATVSKTLYTSTVTGYGKIVSKGGVGFPDLTAPTIAQVGAYIGTELACTVTLDPSIDDTLTIGAPMVGLTTYQALQVLANTVGGYAIDTADGNVAICLYDDTPTLSVDAGLMVKLPDVEEQDFGITGVRVTVSAESYDADGTIPAVDYESATPINLLAENPYMTQALFDDMESHLVGYTYRPATIGLTLGDPRIEGNDVLEVTDADGSVYTVPCHMVKHIYTGGLKSEILAVKPTNSADGIGSISPIQTRLDRLNSGVVTAKSEASKAQTIANTTRQHFWFWDTIPTGADPLVGTGAHISEVSEEDFNDSTSPLYHSGGNLLARSNGIAVRDGLTELATFGASGATIGQTGQMHIEMDADSFVMGDGQTEIAHIGCPPIPEITDTFYYDGFSLTLTYTPNANPVVKINDVATTGYTRSGKTLVIQQSTGITKGDIVTATYTTTEATDFAYYTFGKRNGNAGKNSFAEGTNTIASGNSSHAEGGLTQAVGAGGVHAEGNGTKAYGYASHAEGFSSISSGHSAHSEGYHNQANGDHSHAQNYRTVADYDNQTVIGRYNDNKSDTAFEIGNGTSDNARSNALTVDWQGNVQLALDTTSASGTDHDLYVAITALGWQSEVIV